MTALRPVRIGLVGVNTWHAEAFTDVLLGQGGADHLPPIEGAGVTAVWGEPAQAREDLAVKTGADRFAGDPSEMIPHIDLAFILDDTGGGERHRELAEPFLRAGVPTIVDKPMALTLEDAEALFALAERHAAPIMSSSALRFAAELADRMDEFAALGEVRTATVLGPGEWYYYGIHAAELLLTIMPAPVKWVDRQSTEHQDIAVIGFADGRLASVTVLRDAHYTFTAAIYGTEGWASVEVTRNYEFYRAELQAAAEMARSGVSPVGKAQTMDVLRVLHAGIRSKELGRAVGVEELRD
jgi:predicted dehydrogenase